MSTIKIKEKEPMPWYQKIFYIVSFIVLIWAFIYFGTKNYNAPIKKLNDNESFTEEYGITKDNVFVYKTAEETLEALNTGSAIIFMGFKENVWSATYAEILNETAKKFNVSEIWYYNFKNDRANNNHYYRNIVRVLSPYLKTLDTSNQDIYAPTLVFVKNGVVVGFDNETCIVDGDISVNDYWTIEKKEQKSVSLGVLFQNYLEAS